MKQEDLKILLLGKFYPIRGGVEKVMYDLMLGLSARKVDCDMLCALDKGDSQIIPLNEHARLIGSPSWAKIANNDLTGHDSDLMKNMPELFGNPCTPSRPHGLSGVILLGLQGESCPSLAQRHPETENAAQILQAVTELVAENSRQDCRNNTGISPGITVSERGTGENGLPAYWCRSHDTFT